MKLQSKTYTSYNFYFIAPFLLWVLLGAFWQWTYDKQLLFSYVNNRYNDLLDTVMIILTNMGEGILILPVLLLLLLKKEYRNLRFIGAALFANIGAFLFSQALKSYYDFPRPLNYFHEAKWIHIAHDWERYFHRSFPSGHATGAFAFFSFLSFLLKPHHKGWGVFFFALALLVAYSRLYLAAHFFADVYVGSIIGVFFSTLAITLFYQKPYLRNQHES